MKLIKIKEDHYVVVDDSEIKEKSGDWFYSFETGKIYDTLIHYTAVSCKKITHSTQPLEYFFTDPKNSSKVFRFDKVKYISLQEVKELIGEVDVEKKADKMFPNPYFVMEGLDITPAYKEGYVVGYNQAIEDNKEKKYTEDDLRNAYRHGTTVNHGTKEHFNSFIQSLQSKTEWEVEIVDGKLKLL